MHRVLVSTLTGVFALTSAALCVAQDELTAAGGSPPEGATASSSASIEAGYELSILYVNIPGNAHNVVPTLGAPFTAGSGTTNFVRPYFSADGTHWAIQAIADTGSTADGDVYIVDGALFLQEGTPAPWQPTEMVGTLDDQIGINNAGQILVTNNTSATVNDDYVALFTPPATWTTLAQEAGPIGALVPALTGATWDDALESPVLTNAGMAAFEADLIDGAPVISTTDDILVLGNTVVAENGVTIPAGQAFGATYSWQNFDAGDFYVSPDGLNTLIQGDTDNPLTTEDSILVFNGTVVIQENQPLAGTAFVEPVDTSGIVQGWLDSAGDWFARGNNDVTEQDWVVRNGVLIAASNAMDEIVAGSGEHWSDTDYGDCFYLFDGNSSGAWILGGVTDAPSTANGVIIYDDGVGNRKVVVRENDPVDTDGNGLFDDDRYFNTFGNDDARLLDDGTIWFTATLRDGAGAAHDQGVFVLRPTTASCTFRNGTGINPPDYDCTTLPLLGDNWTTVITPTATTAGSFVILTPAATPAFFFPLFGGDVLVDLSSTQIVVATTANVLSVPIPSMSSLDGNFVATQGLRLDTPGGIPGIVLLNALDVVIGH